jgi:YHS domain-containing protein
MRKSAIFGAVVMAVAAAGSLPMGTVRGAEATTAPAVVDVKNTKCIVAKDDVGDSKLTVTYKGKLYHLCCADCKKDFEGDPEKYVKALEKDPGAYGVK